MRTALAIATLAATAALSPSAAPVAEHVERLSNPGFEVDAAGWRPTTGTELARSTTAHGGRYSAALQRPAGGTVMLNDVPDTAGVPAGSSCRATAWVAAPAGKAVRLRLRELDSTGAVVADPVAAATATGGWQQLAVDRTTAGGPLDLNVWALSMGAADVLRVDDVSLSCRPPDVVFHDGFDRADGLVTNEYATWNPTSAAAVTSANWSQNSGSTFVRSGAAWSGVPDGNSPDATSSTSTGSAVYRLTTRQSDFGEVAVAFRLRLDRFVTTSRTPAVAWDGIHVFLRYQSEEQLYYASVNRRDGAVVIKKKCAGGATNGGTYSTLASTGAGRHPVPLGAWQDVAASVDDNADGTVTLRLWRAGTLLLETTDRGTGCPPLTGTGAVGIRGDNAEFAFDDFTVRSR